MHILIVEDEIKLAQALAEGLQQKGYKVSVAHTGEDGFFMASDPDIGLLVLDIMLPGRSGLEILQKLRQQENPIPVLILSARDTLEDKIRGFDLGADDYLVKPFAFSELYARVQAISRRGHADTRLQLTLSDLQLNLLNRHVSRANTHIELTRREFELLEYLLQHQGNIVSREMLAKNVWKQAHRATPLDNVIDVHIAKLRQKIDTPFDQSLLHTVRGVGFIMEVRTK